MRLLNLTCWAAIVLAAGTVAVRAEDVTPSCQLHRQADLDMYADTLGRPAIPVDINGNRKTFLIDTAGIFSMVTPETVSSANLRTKQAKVPLVLVNGDRPQKMAIAENLTIGTITLSQVPLPVIPESMSFGNSAGQISGDILHVFDNEFDFAAARFSLFLPDTCGARHAYWTQGSYGEVPFKKLPKGVQNLEWHITIPAKLDGIDIWVTINTGTTTSFMIADKTRLTLAKKIWKQHNPDAKKLPPAYMYPFQALSIGNVTIYNPDIMLLTGNAPDWKKAKPELILGMSVLSQLHLYISYKDKKVYLTSASTK